SSLVFSLSPWSILFAHTAYEAPNALMFYLLGIYWLISLAETKKTSQAILLTIGSFLAYFVGFYSYHGYKLIMPVLVGVPFVWQWWLADKKTKVKLTKPYLVFGGLMLLLVIKFLTSMSGYGDRQSELIFLDQEFLAELVNSSRKLGFLTPITSLLINKYTVLAREIGIRYLATFNPTNLFITGTDSTVLFSLFQTGYAYLIELPLIIIGGWFLHKNYKNTFYLLSALLLVAPLPAALHHGTSTALRAGLIFPLLAVFIAAGWYHLFSLQGLLGSFLKLITVGSLLINFGYFFYIFQNNYPVYSADNYFFKERLLAKYLKLAQENQKPVTVLSKNPYPGFRAYLFYQNELQPEKLAQLVPEFKQGVYSNYNFENFSWTSDCSVLEQNINGYLVVEEELLSECSKEKTASDRYDEIYLKTQVFPQFIASPIDSRNYYVIFNSELCASSELNSYVYNSQRSAFALEKLTRSEFCTKWIIRDGGLEERLIKLSNIN
ncbi:MAG: hypothetical protein IT416_01040, partial [Candidatus Pacebacteria bacterium]|nr:hypothetical protein [Candidatus Paceibacterota bacterium]